MQPDVVKRILTVLILPTLTKQAQYPLLFRRYQFHDPVMRGDISHDNSGSKWGEEMPPTLQVDGLAENVRCRIVAEVRGGRGSRRRPGHADAAFFAVLREQSRRGRGGL